MVKSVTGKIRLIYYYLIGLIGMCESDVILAAYPRSGSTWVRFLLCNLISLQEWGGKTVNFSLLNQTMVELGVSDLTKPWLHTTLPRVVKTHKPYWPVFRKAGDVIGVVRDPRDVMVSYFHYKKDRQESYEGDFSRFIRNQRFGLEAWFKHYVSWQPHYTLLVRYEELKQDTYGEFSRILELLNVRCPTRIINEAIERSNIQNIRKVEGSSNGLKTKDELFARDGSTQQWCDYFSARDLSYYESLVMEYDFDLYKYG